MRVRTTGKTTEITVNNEQLNTLIHGVRMILDQYPCKASRLRDDHPDKAHLAKMEAMYISLGGKLSCLDY